MNLPTPAPITRPLTYTSPHLLLSAAEVGGALRLHVEQGGSRQVDVTTETTYSTDLLPEEPTLVIKMTNKVRFMDALIDVLNDPVDLPSLKLPASVPSASEYLALRGQKTTIHFMRRRDPSLSTQMGLDVYRYDRVTLLLP